jgi:hypothetical protein
LVLDGCGIDDIGAKHLSQMIENNSSMTELHLARNAITTSGMMALSTALERNSTLQLLDLYDNQLGNTRRHDIAVATLMKCMEKNGTLTELNLGNNDIGELGWASKSAIDALFSGPPGANAIAQLITRFSEQQEEKRLKLREQKSHAREAADIASKTCLPDHDDLNIL